MWGNNGYCSDLRTCTVLASDVVHLRHGMVPRLLTILSLTYTLEADANYPKRN